MLQLYQKHNTPNQNLSIGPHIVCTTLYVPTGGKDQTFHFSQQFHLVQCLANLMLQKYILQLQEQNDFGQCLQFEDRKRPYVFLQKDN